LLLGVGVASIFAIMTAVGENFATLMLGRFFSGCFGVSSVAVLGAVTDNWSAIDRGVALSAVICMVFSGPMIGPIIGNFVCASYLGWRWTMVGLSHPLSCDTQTIELLKHGSKVLRLLSSLKSLY